MLCATPIGLVLGATATLQKASAEEIDTIIVTAPGGGADRDDALEIDTQAISKTGQPDLLASLTRSIAGITLQDSQGNPWQPNLVYRGFVASPLQGQAQGLAVYLDGGRFNQPLGDTVPFDLLPDAAVEKMHLFDSSAVYGLNALGGAIAIETKTGRSAPGVTLSAAGGRYAAYDIEGSAGWASGQWSAFLAASVRHDGGWREASQSTLYNGYADFGVDSEKAGLHIKLTGADTDLRGNGVAPVELLAADWSAVFTVPDRARSRYWRASVHPWVELSEQSHIEASLYAQHLRQRTVNGDAADIEACEDPLNAGMLCLESQIDGDPEELLFDSSGTPVADTGDDLYGVLNRGTARTRSAGILVQLIDERPLFGGENHLAIGFSHDRSRTGFASSAELGFIDDDRAVNALGLSIVQPSGSIAPVSLTATTRYTGLFVSETLPITRRLSAEIGLRYNDARIRLRDRIGTALNGKHHFKRLNPGIELDYELSDALMLRAGYAESNRAPTPAELSCADEGAPCSLANFFVADPPLKQVVAKNWELGASGGMTRGGWKLHWLLSGYRTTSSNDIQFIASSIRGRGYFRNVGTSRRQGVELTVDLSRGPLAVRAGYAFTDARFRSPFIVSSPANPGADANGEIAVSRGNRIPGIPRHSATLSADYEGQGWTVGGDVQIRSGQYHVGDEANLVGRTPGYAVVNVRGGFDILPGLKLFGEVHNLFDKHYATFGTFMDVGEVPLDEAPNASDPRAYGPGAPRRWRVGMKAVF
jgi:outer membrane receptor protein involved in Fe transport